MQIFLGRYCTEISLSMQAQCKYLFQLKLIQMLIRIRRHAGSQKPKEVKRITNIARGLKQTFLATLVALHLTPVSK